MEGLISIAQIRKQLRNNGREVPSAEAIYHVITKYGCKPIANRKGYYKKYAKTLLDMHFSEALEYDRNKEATQIKTANMQPSKPEGSTYGRDYVRDGANNMQAYSQHLINQDNFGPDDDVFESVENKTVVITENQYKRLFENTDTEGISFRNGVMTFRPDRNFNADTSIFDDDMNLKVRQQLLPKSGVMSYNLYRINNMSVNKGLKHRVDASGNQLQWQQWQTKKGEYADDEQRKANTQSIDWFLKRSVMYMRYIIGNRPVDYITYPQSSSDFNNRITNMLIGMYPNSEGIKLVPKMLIKNVRGITVNKSIAKSLGLTDVEIADIEKKIEKWHNDEDIRDIRRKIDALKQETAEILASTQHRRGRKPGKIADNDEAISNYLKTISSLRKKVKARGIDPTISDNGKTRDWQIKTVDDKIRRALDNIFIINPEYQKLIAKLAGKTIVVFDDNISSGATLDEICVALKMFNVAEIIPITLGTIDPTMYKPSERGVTAS